jgi:hypothetical protein
MAKPAKTGTTIPIVRKLFKHLWFKCSRTWKSDNADNYFSCLINVGVNFRMYPRSNHASVHIQYYTTFYKFYYIQLGIYIYIQFFSNNLKNKNYYNKDDIEKEKKF